MEVPLKRNSLTLVTPVCPYARSVYVRRSVLQISTSSVRITPFLYEQPRLPNLRIPQLLLPLYSTSGCHV